MQSSYNQSKDPNFLYYCDSYLAQCPTSLSVRFKVDKRMVGAQQADVVATGITDTTLTVTGLKTGFEHNITVYTAGNRDMYHRNGESVKVSEKIPRTIDRSFEADR
jgi:hypothetical protein